MQILLFGERRFKDFTASPEHILINLLSDRLARLMARASSNRCRRTIPSTWLYHLTAKDEALRPIFVTLRDWGLSWLPGTQALAGGG